MNVSSIYRLATKLYSLAPYYASPYGHAFPPWHFFFEVTRRCNLRCRMCQYIDWFKATPISEQKEGELTTQEWFDVVDQVPSYGVITFTGGEPFLRDDFMDILDRASRRSRTHFISNAVLIDEDRARHCIDLAPKRLGGKGLNFAGISIEGPPEIHNEIRGIPNGFERSTGAIRNLTQLRDKAGKACPKIHVTSVIQQDNVDTLHEMPGIIAGLGGDVLNLTLEIRWIDLPGLGTQDPCCYAQSEVPFPHIEAGRLAEALRRTRKAAQEAHIELRTPNMPDQAIIDYYQGSMNLKNFHCDAIWTTLIIGAKGDVFPCWLMKVGNIRENTLKQLWNGAKLRHFRRCSREGLPAPCVGCCLLDYGGRKSMQREKDSRA